MENQDEFVTKLLKIYRENTLSEKEIEEAMAENDKIVSSFEYIDNDIYETEHSLILDGIIDWHGCRINENWEKYKERIGYYTRHPEREEESRAFTKAIMEWYQNELGHANEH